MGISLWCHIFIRVNPLSLIQKHGHRKGKPKINLLRRRRAYALLLSSTLFTRQLRNHAKAMEINGNDTDIFAGSDEGTRVYKIRFPFIQTANEHHNLTRKVHSAWSLCTSVVIDNVTHAITKSPFRLRSTSISFGTKSKEIQRPPTEANSSVDTKCKNKPKWEMLSYIKEKQT